MTAIGVDIKLAGASLDPALIQRLQEVRVDDHLLLPDTAVVRLADPELVHVDDPRFAIGAELEIHLGARTGASQQKVFAGQVVAFEPEFGPAGGVLVLRAYDHSHVLHRDRRSTTHQNVTADDVARKVANGAGLGVGTIDAAGAPMDFVQQSNETDWELLWRLAAPIGFEVVVEDKKLHFRRGTAPPERTLRWGDGLRSFRPRVTGVNQAEKVTVRGWDPKQKRAIEATATPKPAAKTGVDHMAAAHALGGGTVTIANRPVENDAEAKALAESVAGRLGAGFAEAEGVCEGDPTLRAGTRATVEKVGTRFGGAFTVTSTVHVFRGDRGYETRFASSGRLDRSILALTGGPAKRADWTSQLVIGVVTNNDDPASQGRVRVTYPALGEGVEGWWARVLVLGAGKERGAAMCPVPGDEVLLGFEHGDPNRPIVLGGLFNGIDLPGKVVVTDGSLVARSDHDASIRAEKDLHLAAGGTAKLESEKGASLELSADGKLDASGSLKLTGGSTIDVSASGQLTIKGATVTIESSGPLKLSAPQVMVG